MIDSELRNMNPLLEKSITRKEAITGMSTEDVTYLHISSQLCEKFVHKYFWLIAIMWTSRSKSINCNYFCWPSTINWQLSWQRVWALIGNHVLARVWILSDVWKYHLLIILPLFDWVLQRHHLLCIFSETFFNHCFSFPCSTRHILPEKSLLLWIFLWGFILPFTCKESFVNCLKVLRCDPRFYQCHIICFQCLLNSS